MGFQYETPSPEIIVFAQSAPWCSAIRRYFVDDRISWVLNIEGLLEESYLSQATVAIVECSTPIEAENCEKLYFLANNSHYLKLFVVGDEGLLGWRPQLRAIGVAAWYWSFLQVPALVQTVTTHRRSCPVGKLSIEQRVSASLPWPTAANKDQV